MPGPVRGEKSDAGWGQQQRWLKGCSEDAAFETSRGKSLNEARRPGGWWADALRPLHPVGLSFQGGRFLACLLTRYFFLFQLAAPTATCLAYFSDTLLASTVGGIVVIVPDSSLRASSGQRTRLLQLLPCQRAAHAPIFRETKVAGSPSPGSFGSCRSVARPE